MPYKCAFGCTSYDPCCDGCDDETTGSNPYDPHEDSRLLKAARRGQTLSEYLDDDSPDNKEWP